MLSEFRLSFPSLRRAALLSLASLCSLSVAAQAPSSDSSAPQTTPAPAQGGTTAAPGTAPIRNRNLARSLAPVKVATYDEKFELYGGINLMNGQAGQNLPKRYNMGGGEVMGTYWLGSHLGVAGDYRIGAGTTDVFPTQFFQPGTRLVVIQNIVSGGVNYRGPKNRYVAVDYHALVGATHGTFDHSITDYPNHPPTLNTSVVGLYSNSTSPWGAIGGSLDFNYTPKLAIRLSPDLTFEHFGSETREFFAISAGVVYRFGKRTR